MASETIPITSGFYAPYIITEKKSTPNYGPSPAEQRINRQMDVLQSIAKNERDQRWGANHVAEMKDFFELNYYPATAQPSYRPRIILPEIQFLLMSEATELTSDMPKCFIYVNGKQDEKREKAFAATWRQGLFNNRIFEAVFWSQFANPGWLQVGINPLARNGKGSVWVASRDPETVFADGHAKNDRTWSYVLLEDYFYVDEIRRNWPEQGWRVKVGAGYDDYVEPETGGSSFDLSMELPPGPLRVDAPQGFEHQRNGPRVRVRLLWIKDYAREVVREIAGEETARGLELVIRPEAKWRFPNGRFIVESQGIVLADGPNFIPRLPEDDFGTFPVLGAWSMPHLQSIYGPSPVRYGKGPQDIAERMYTQLVENMIRTNNAQAFIPRDSGIDIDAYGGLPGEVQVFDGDKTPELKWPNPIPQHMVGVPEALLQKVARYLGWTPERQGQAAAGNVSTDLFDASVFQSEALLRMKAKLLSETYQRLCTLLLHMMVRFKTIPDTIRPPRGSQEPSVWLPVPDSAEVELEMDESSVDAISSNMLKKLVIPLAKLGLVPTKFALEQVGIPHADEMAAAAERQMALAALAKLRRPR